MRLGDVLVGKLADRVAGQHRLHAISGTLPGNRATEARLLADDQDGGFLVPVGAERYADFGGAGFGHIDAGGLGPGARLDGPPRVERKSVGSGTSVSVAVVIGVRCYINKNKTNNNTDEILNTQPTEI